MPKSYTKKTRRSLWKYGYKKEGSRTKADRVLAQGVGKTPKKPFGNGSKTSCSDANVSLKCWDAFHPYHLPLPRSVGPYTVVRTTCNFTSTDRIVMIAPFKFSHTTNLTTDNSWSTMCALHSVDSGLAINAANNGFIINTPFPGLSRTGSALTATPAAISVQVMNSNALQTTSGMVFGAVCPAQFDLRGRTDTWSEFGDEIISFMKPRMMSAGKLALRGVQADSYPLDMNSLSDFRGVEKFADATTTVSTGNNFSPDGWAPMVIVNKGSTLTPALELNYLVTIEWRVRFDISNPAVASHRNHGVTPDSTWDALIKKASSRAHGMIDIVERVANIGATIAAAAA